MTIAEILIIILIGIASVIIGIGFGYVIFFIVHWLLKRRIKNELKIKDKKALTLQERIDEEKKIMKEINDGKNNRAIGEGESRDKQPVVKGTNETGISTGNRVSAAIDRVIKQDSKPDGSINETIELHKPESI